MGIWKNALHPFAGLSPTGKANQTFTRENSFLFVIDINRNTLNYIRHFVGDQCMENKASRKIGRQQ